MGTAATIPAAACRSPRERRLRRRRRLAAVLVVAAVCGALLSAASRLAGSSAATLPGRVAAASIPAPVVAQRLRDNCETAALQVLLATMGVRADQLTLQRQLERSGPLDPQGPADNPVWGDPDRGFVGRADGSGPWGGFGVFPRPLARLAARHGRRVRELTGSRPSTVYRELAAGRAVMAWVGLGDGPYRSWRSPSGRPIRVNLNEHAVVLTGRRADGAVELVNVLHGTRELWSRYRFERAWALLGGRALAAT